MSQDTFTHKRRAAVKVDAGKIVEWASATRAHRELAKLRDVRQNWTVHPGAVPRHVRFSFQEINSFEEF